LALAKLLSCIPVYF